MKLVNELALTGTLVPDGEAKRLGIEERIRPVRGVDLAKLTEGDPEPMFVFVKALKVGVSQNNRRYARKHLDAYLKALPLYGFLGHPYVPTDAQYPPYRGWVTAWVGGAVEKDGEETWLYLKGYVPPEQAELRADIRRSLAVGKPMSVSIWGRMATIRRQNGIEDVTEVKPLSVDWAPPGEQGVEGATAVGTAGEEQTSKQEDIVERHEVIRELTAGELMRENPGLHKVLGDEAVKTFRESGEFTGLRDKAALAEKLTGEVKGLKLELVTAHRAKLLGEMQLPAEGDKKELVEGAKRMADRLLGEVSVTAESDVKALCGEMDKTWEQVRQDVGELYEKQGLPLFGGIKPAQPAGEQKKQESDPHIAG